MRSRTFQATLCGLFFLTCLTTSSQAAAESLSSSPMEAAAAAFDGEQTEGLAALASKGASFEGVLSMEALPGGGVAAEIAIGLSGNSARYPIKLSAADEGGCQTWSVSWTPDAAYTVALVNMLASGQLPATSTAPAWVSYKRLPALPVLLTRQKIITPYGVIDIAESTSGAEPSQPGADIAPPPALVKHTQRWLREYLEGEEGAANVDIITDGRATWRDLTRVVFGVASQGFYKLYLVTMAPGGLAAIETAAPIFGSLPGVKKPVPLVIGYYPQGEQAGVRISQGSAVLQKEEACAPEMSFCVADGAAFTTRLQEIARGMRAKKPTNPSHAMFATTGEVTIGAALPWLELVGAALSIHQRRVFIGYIQR